MSLYPWWVPFSPSFPFYLYMFLLVQIEADLAAARRGDGLWGCSFLLYQLLQDVSMMKVYVCEVTRKRDKGTGYQLVSSVSLASSPSVSASQGASSHVPTLPSSLSSHITSPIHHVCDCVCGAKIAPAGTFLTGVVHAPDTKTVLFKRRQTQAFCGKVVGHV